MGVARLWRAGPIARWWSTVFGRRQVRIGLYGPPTAGKTTLANRIALDFSGEPFGPSTGIPHETREVRTRDAISIVTQRGGRLHVSIADTPGIATKVDFNEFMGVYGLPEDEARTRAKQATEGVIEAIRWLENVDCVILVLDSAADPFTQVNVTILGNLEAREIPLVIAANKIDLPNASPAALRGAFPQHPVVPVSALSGYNMGQLYESLVRAFR